MSLIITNTPTIPSIQNVIKKPIHNGEQTHHQDQVATTPIPPNFNARNIKNTEVLKLMLCVVFSFSIL